MLETRLKDEFFMSVCISMLHLYFFKELKVRKPQNNKKASGSNQEQTHTTENVSSESQGATGSS